MDETIEVVSCALADDSVDGATVEPRGGVRRTVTDLDDGTSRLIASLELAPEGPARVGGSSTTILVRGKGEREVVMLRLWRPDQSALLAVRNKLRTNSALGTHSGVAAPIKFGTSDDLAIVWALYNTSKYSPIQAMNKPEIILPCISEIALTLIRSGHHGNLKPGNILISSTGGQPLVMDFGFEKNTTAAALSNRDVTLMFQPGYLVDGRSTDDSDEFMDWRRKETSDAFALAALCIHLLSAKAPSWADLISNTSNNDNSAIWEPLIPHGLSASLTSVLKSALVPQRIRRGETLANLARDLLSSEEARLTEAKTRRLKQKGWSIDPPPSDTNENDDDDDDEQIPEEDTNKDQGPWDLNLLLPPGRMAGEICQALDRFVIGQEFAKKEFSVLLSMHLTWFEEQNRLHKPPNAILVGSTGIGKTHSLRTAAEYLRIPYTIIDATSLVPSGIVGYQIEDAIADLVAGAESILAKSGRARFPDDDIKLAERGILFIDEFDKLVRSRDARDDYGKEQVQRRLLKAIEGSIMSVGVTRHTGDVRRSLDTSGLLFIASGAFQGIDSPKIRSQRPDRLQRVLKTTEGIIAADLITYGFLPELIARLQTIIRFAELTTEQLEGILRNMEVTPTAVWENHFKRLGKELVITDDALRAVALSAGDLGLGARGLQQVLFPLLSSVAYDLETSSDQRFVLEEHHVLRGRRAGS